MAFNSGRSFVLPFVIPQAELLAPTNIDFQAPFDGRVDELQTVVQAAVTTGGIISVQINGVAVAGLSVTIPDGAAKGSRLSDKPTTPSATRSFKKGDLLSIVPGAPFATAGAVNGNLLLVASPGEVA